MAKKKDKKLDLEDMNIEAMNIGMDKFHRDNIELKRKSKTRKKEKKEEKKASG